MRRILIAYDSAYGATRTAAGLVAEVLSGRGCDVDVRVVGAGDILGYDAAIIGGPIRLGRCSPRTRRFLRRERSALAQMPVACFFTCMSVTRAASAPAFPVSIDPAFSALSGSSPRKGFMERTHTADYYLEHFLKLMPGIAPLGIGFFKGNLDLARLSPVHRLLMRFAIFSLPEIQEGQYLDSELVRAWAEAVSTRLEECWRDRAGEAARNA